MTDWHSKEGKLIVDGKHYAYWNSRALVYVRDGGSYTRSTVGPHFLDLGVMGNCRQNCYNCYMRDKGVASDMTWEAADEIVYRYKNSLCQLSFGGAGDPLDYYDFPRLLYAGNGRSREEYEKTRTVPETENTPSEKAISDWHAWNESINTIARCVTINPRQRALTRDQIATLGRFKAVGLSCGDATGYDVDRGTENLVRLLREAEELDWNRRPCFILHLIVGDMHNDLRKFIKLLTYDCVGGVLFLARKGSVERKGWKGGPFYDREMQSNFWKSVAAVYDVVRKSVAVDSCLAPFVDRELFPNFDPATMHPCDAGRFSLYMHADGKPWLCSCGKKAGQVVERRTENTTVV